MLDYDSSLLWLQEQTTTTYWAGSKEAPTRWRRRSSKRWLHVSHLKLFVIVTSVDNGWKEFLWKYKEHSLRGWAARYPTPSVVSHPNLLVQLFPVCWSNIGSLWNMSSSSTWWNPCSHSYWRYIRSVSWCPLLCPGNALQWWENGYCITISKLVEDDDWNKTATTTSDATAQVVNADNW